MPFHDRTVEFRTVAKSCQDIINLPIDMPFHDRTVEFRTVAKSCQFRHQPNGNILEAKGEREKMLQSSIHFNQLAKRIGRDLSMTCAKMEKLSQLAKNKSLFDDRASEIEELSQTIKQDITGLNKQIANLQQVALHRSGSKSNSSKNEQQGQNHSKLVVVGLQSKLASISKTFKNVLEIRTENLKLKRARREKFSQSAAIPSNLPPSASNGNMGSLLLYDDMAASSGSSSFTLDMDRLEQHRIQDQVALIDETDTYHRSRYSAMEGIESSIAELGTIFRQLASLVSEQGEMITRIDSNVEDTALNVEAAHYELLKYFNNISRNRWLILKVFGVLMAFFIFFVIFMT
uniref:t-SNARE coiled-coil homology domain-containing protein n=1 Tax=Meloidogyne incognita TaxID=6306 RepID=A0A914NAM9_MELIC